MKIVVVRCIYKDSRLLRGRRTFPLIMPCRACASTVGMPEIFVCMRRLVPWNSIAILLAGGHADAASCDSLSGVASPDLDLACTLSRQALSILPTAIRSKICRRFAG